MSGLDKKIWREKTGTWEMAGQVLGQGITSTHKTSRIQHKRRLMYDEWSAKRRVGLLHRESPVHNPIDWVHRRGSEESRGPLLWSGRQDNTSITYTFRLGHFPKRKKHTPRNTTPKENCTVISHNSPSQRGFAESTSKRKRHHRSTILFYQSISFSRSFFWYFFLKYFVLNGRRYRAREIKSESFAPSNA